MSETDNKYLLLIADYFTKWPEAYALPNQEAASVAGVLVKEYVCHYGVSLELHSDQGRNFESNLFQEMCALLGINKTPTTPLHPQSEGMVERLNRTLEAQLSKFVDEHLGPLCAIPDASTTVCNTRVDKMYTCLAPVRTGVKVAY